ncbi:hypothetical protein HZU67_03183 [Apis mellifera carnica]|nr:hypothetical protein HZU67_03183 [Apis mellifera carnica]
MEFPLSRKCRRCTIMIKGRFMFTAHCFRRTTRDCFYANTSKCYNLRGVSYDAKVTWVKIVDHYRRLQVSFQEREEGCKLIYSCFGTIAWEYALGHAR